MNNQRLETQLLQLFDKLFQKQYLEKNIYIFNQMKPNLEIPVSLIFKERKIAQVTTDESVIIDALKKCNRVTLNEDGKTLRINIPLTKTKLIVDADKTVLEELPAFADVTLFSGYRWEVDKNHAIIYGNDETQVAALKSLLQKETGLVCTIEESDPFLDLKDSVEKAKQQKKERNSYPGYQNYQQAAMWANLNMYNFNPYAGKFQRPRGPGFIRRAVESSDEEDNKREEARKETAIVKQQRKQKQHGKQHKEHHKEKDHGKEKESPKDKRLKYREKEVKEHKEHKEPISQIEKRTRLNSENFPEIERQIQKQVLRVKYTKADIVDIYSRIAPNIPINPELQKSGIPLLNGEGVFKLEAMKPGGRKESTFDTPKVIIVPRKSSS